MYFHFKLFLQIHLTTSGTEDRLLESRHVRFLGLLYIPLLLVASTHLLSKLPRQVERDAAEIGVPQQVVQVVGQQLEDQAEVVPPHEVVLQLDDVVLVAGVGAVHQLEEPDLDLGLVQERLLVLDDLDGHVAALFVVVRFDNLEPML
jgi:hypothetical protein